MLISCDNHRGISLLAIAGKILARILLNRLIDHLENGHLPETQCGFRKSRGTARVRAPCQKKLNGFHISCLRKLLKLNWKDIVPDTDVLEQAGMASVRTLLQKAQLRWVGHILRMRLPKRLLFGELSNGKCQRGRPKLRFKDALKVSLKNFDIDIKTSGRGGGGGLVHNRSSWRSYVHKGAASHEQNRISDL